MKFEVNLRKIRRYEDVTQKTIAEQLGVVPTTYTRYELMGDNVRLIHVKNTLDILGYDLVAVKRDKNV